MRAVSSIFFISLRHPDLENISLSNVLNLSVLRNTLTANDKHPVRYFENLLSPIQMTLSLKRKTFVDSFVPFLESTSNFKRFEKKYDRHSYFISDFYRLSKPLVDHSLKTSVSEHPLTVNMLKGPKLFYNHYESPFIIFFHHSDVEIICLSDRLNLSGVL